MVVAFGLGRACGCGVLAQADKAASTKPVEDSFAARWQDFVIMVGIEIYKNSSICLCIAAAR